MTRLFSFPRTLKAVLVSTALALAGLAQAQAVFKITAIPDESETPCGHSGSAGFGFAAPWLLHWLGSLKNLSGTACSSALMYCPLTGC